MVVPEGVRFSGPKSKNEENESGNRARGQGSSNAQVRGESNT